MRLKSLLNTYRIREEDETPKIFDEKLNIHLFT